MNYGSVELAKEITKMNLKIRDLEKKKENANVESRVMIDEEIKRIHAAVKNLEYSEELKRLEETGELEEKLKSDPFLHAIVQAQKVFDEISEKSLDLNGESKEVNAFFRLSNAISCMQYLKLASECRNNEGYPYNDEFLDGIHACIAEKDKNIQEIRGKITVYDEKIENVKSELDTAMKEGNPAAIIEKTEALEKVKREREYILPMIDAAEMKPVFPEGFVKKEWKAIAGLYHDEFIMLTEIIKMTQIIQHQAAQELVNLVNGLRSTRSKMQQVARDNGSEEEIVKYNQIVTKGVNMKDISGISDADMKLIKRCVFFSSGQLL